MNNVILSPEPAAADQSCRSRLSRLRPRDAYNAGAGREIEDSRDIFLCIAA
jgi:hypothetical protein